ncbi:MAG TPA: DUF4142 domain-containing protein, partial [Gemmatimonadaceae bacterium]|nr:DUF4142 domain-containing protein [Gemmatimonadaceae bacterium]
MRFDHLGLAFVLAAAALTSACGRGEQAADTGLAAGGTAAATAPAGAPSAGESSAAPAPALGDAEIAHVAVTANAIDSAFGVMAAPKATNADVRSFARRMSSDHGGVNEQAVALATKLGVTPADNDVSRSLHRAADASRDSLESLSGAAFDRAYLDREVAFHQAVLDALDRTLIPGSRNGELKALLEQVRPAVAAHLDLARDIRGKLGAR